MDFGKHKGSLWIELDRGYLTWLINSSDIKDKKYIYAKETLDYFDIQKSQGF